MIKTTQTPQNEPPITTRLLTVKDVAERLQVSGRTIHRLIDTGRIAVIRIGRSLRVSEEALKALLTEKD